MSSKIKPPLLAFLICEKAMMEEDRVVSLLRIVDTFHLEAEIAGATEEQLNNMSLGLACVVFTRWGPGRGEFTEELGLLLPNEEEAALRQSVTFTLPGGFSFMQIRHHVSFAVQKPGIYRFRVYLDGELTSEQPFRVEIRKKLVAPGAS